jgi:hypothetical protein
LAVALLGALLLRAGRAGLAAQHVEAGRDGECSGKGDHRNRDSAANGLGCLLHGLLLRVA